MVFVKRDHENQTPHDGEPAALAVADVRYVYPGGRRAVGRVAVDGVSFDLEPGRLVAMLGPNGCGKSTLIRVICGLTAAQRGRIELFGRPVERSRAQLGVVFQSPSLDPRLTVRENLHDQAVWYGLDRATAQRRVEDDLRAADFIDRADERVRTLSGGLARRVDLVRAMLHRPALILLDEPTVGLDPAAREQFLKHLIDAREQRNLTVLLTTHLIDEADRAERVIMMDQGRIVADDRPDALRRAMGRFGVTVWSVDRPDDVPLDWRATPGGWRAWLDDAAGQGGGDGNAMNAQAIAERLIDTGRAMSFGPPTLADVFEARTGRRLHEESDEGGPFVSSDGSHEPTVVERAVERIGES